MVLGRCAADAREGSSAADGHGSLIINLAEDEIRAYSGANDDVVAASRCGRWSVRIRNIRVIDTHEQRAVLGVNFKPGGMTPFFDPAADELRECHASLSDLWGTRAIHCANGCCRHRRLSHDCAGGNRAAAARYCGRCGGAPKSISSSTNWTRVRTARSPMLSQRAGLSATAHYAPVCTRDRTDTEALCARQTLRARASAFSTPPICAWIDLAHRCGYFDQPHFITTSAARFRAARPRNCETPDRESRRHLVRVPV